MDSWELEGKLSDVRAMCRDEVSSLRYDVESSVRDVQGEVRDERESRRSAVSEVLDTVNETTTDVAALAVRINRIESAIKKAYSCHSCRDSGCAICALYNGILDEP